MCGSAYGTAKHAGRGVFDTRHLGVVHREGKGTTSAEPSPVRAQASRVKDLRHPTFRWPSGLRRHGLLG